jgi:AcrR family transcriptional regulator
VSARAPGRPRSTEADDAIVRATLEVLLDEGFRGLSVEAVRQRAGVGKATIYRRFPDKDALVAAAIRSLHQAVQEPPDTGSLAGDVDALLRQGYLADPRITSFGPRLLAEAAGNPEMHAIFRSALIEPRRAFLGAILRRAVERGELRDDVDLEVVIDLIAGPFIYRLLIDGGDPAVLAARGAAPLALLLEGLAPRR